uniref:Uncharacterized protein n=1 Tax=Panagrolaimus sp. PS1159 TaxID=55785 RepID=A0AC35GLM5_9BILA
MDNSHSGRKNLSDYTLDKIYPNKHLKDILAEIRQSQNGYGNEEEEDKNKQFNDKSNDEKFGEQKHGRFRRSAKDRAGAIGGFFLWLLIIGGIVLCCCLPGIILCVILMRR